MSAAAAPARSVAEVMRRDVVTIRPDATLADLARVLRRHGISGVPVVGPDGKAVGVASVTDLLWLSDRVRPTAATLREAPWWEGLERMTVRDVMTPDVFGVEATASLAELFEFFGKTGLHRAMVLEQGRVVGIVSMTDLLGLIEGLD